jgi:hypothetical protein
MIAKQTIRYILPMANPTEEAEARKFAEDHPEIGTDWFVKEDILYYDGGYITGFAARQLEAIEKGED